MLRHPDLVFLPHLFICCSCCLQGPEGDKTVTMALAAPDRYVLKPQREGGGTLTDTCVQTQSFLVPCLSPYTPLLIFCYSLWCSTLRCYCLNIIIVLTGNNIYGSEICKVLEGLKENTERMAYILMDKIHPSPAQNYLLRRDAPLQIRNCLSELGAFGAYVRYVIYCEHGSVSVKLFLSSLSHVILCWNNLNQKWHRDLTL